MQNKFIAERNWGLNFDWSLRSTVSFEWWNYHVTLQTVRVSENQCMENSSISPLRKQYRFLKQLKTEDLKKFVEQSNKFLKPDIKKNIVKYVFLKRRRILRWVGSRSKNCSQLIFFVEKRSTSFQVNWKWIFYTSIENIPDIIFCCFLNSIVSLFWIKK